MTGLIWRSLGGGLIGTVVLSTVLRGASELGVTRMDLPFLLGTYLTADRRHAKALGYLLHLGSGAVFALAYGIVFALIGRAGPGLGALFGLLHALFTATILVNVLLPSIHPRMGTPESSARETPLLEPPGFLMLNYGRNTFLVTLAAHALYGAIIGWAVQGAGMI
jgi:hypothetical protein